MEAVSGILSTKFNLNWDIEKFWEAKRKIFHDPVKSTKCGTHVHITPGPRGRWTLPELRLIAVGIIRYEELMQELLPQARRTIVSATDPSVLVSPLNPDDRNYRNYARSNSSSRSSSRDAPRGADFRRDNAFDTQDSGLEALNRKLQAWSVAGPAKSRTDLLMELQRRIPNMNEKDIADWMQGDRYVLWNFANILPSGSGTVEFRGGAGMRGLIKTRWLIAFVVGFIDFLITDGVSYGVRTPSRPA